MGLLLVVENDNDNTPPWNLRNRKRYSKPTIRQKHGQFDALSVVQPASAKSLFMSSLTKLERSNYTIGSSSTKVGISAVMISA